jgi:hypothetical protein
MPRAVVITLASADFTGPDFTTTMSTAAKATAASVPTAYSAVDIPASVHLRARILICIR